MSDFLTQSGVSIEGVPFVHIILGNERVQMSPDEARQYGLILIESAEAAEHDAFAFHYLTGEVGTGVEGAAKYLSEFRSWRGKRRDDAAAK